MENQSNYWARRAVGRRTVLRGVGFGAAGLAGAALIGCGGGGDDAAKQEATVPSGALSGTATGTKVAGGGTPVPKDQVRLKPGIYTGPVAASPAEANPLVNAKRGGQLQMMYLDPPRMDLSRTLSCTIYTTLNHTNNKLIRGRTGANAPLYTVEIEPDLAESYEVQDNAQQFTFKLRKGVKTHNVPPVNGREFTSEDVLAALELYRKPGSSQSDVLAPVTSITAPDPYTVVVKLNQPLADFPTNLASWSFMYLKELVADENLRQEKAIGTGPFVQKQWIKKEKSIFERHPDYFETGLPFVDGVTTWVQDDLNAQRAGFQTDNYYYWAPRDDKDATDMLKSRGETMVSTKFPLSRGANVNGFQFQMKSPTYQDDRVRRALSLAFDRTEFDNAYNSGDNQNPEGAYSNGPMPWPLLFDEYPTAKANGPWYKFDPKQASQLMQAAGYTKEKPLTFTMQSWYSRQQLSEIIIPGMNQSLPEAKISWKQIDNPTHVTLMSDRNFPDVVGFLWGPAGFSMDQWVYPFYHSKGGTNYGSINDPDLDALLVKQRVTTDLKAKKEVWMQINNRIHDKVYQAWFPEPRVRTAWHNYMLNFRYHAYQGSYTCYAADQVRAVWLDDGTPGLKRA